jgi:hypothetical protein
MQVGWPLLAGMALAGYQALVAHQGSRRSRRHVVRLSVFAALAFLLTWAPLDFWRWLPDVFSCALFTYRLLTFVVLWGCLLLALALGSTFGRGMRVEHATACLLVLGLFVGPYVSTRRATASVTLAGEIAHPDMGRGGGNDVFRLTTPAQVPSQLPLVKADVTRRQTVFGHPTVCRVAVAQRSLAQLPVLYYPHVLHVCIDGQEALYRSVGRYVAVELPIGEHTIAVRFIGIRWANKLTQGVAAGLLLAGAWWILRRCWQARFRRRSHLRDSKASGATPALRLAKCA